MIMPLEILKSTKVYHFGSGNVSLKCRCLLTGNDNVHALTRYKQYKLRFDLGDFDENIRYAVYRHFTIDSDCNKYKLKRLRTYSGDAGR